MTWLSRAAGADALQGEIASLRADTDARIADAARRQDEAIDAMRERLAATNHDIAQAIERLDGIVTASETLGARLAQLEVASVASRAADAQRGEVIDALRGVLARQEQQLKLHIDESAKTWSALIERVELARIAASRLGAAVQTPPG